MVEGGGGGGGGREGERGREVRYKKAVERESETKKWTTVEINADRQAESGRGTERQADIEEIVHWWWLWRLLRQDRVPVCSHGGIPDSFDLGSCFFFSRFMFSCFGMSLFDVHTMFLVFRCLLISAVVFFACMFLFCCFFLRFCCVVVMVRGCCLGAQHRASNRKPVCCFLARLTRASIEVCLFLAETIFEWRRYLT